ncbi:hypothetical protein [Natronorarus salvus]|uniref:hypothetical protein n=1 Tax=Natronorarus salvus TaxID=3117733 RepID=UPI002F269174
MSGKRTLSRRAVLGAGALVTSGIPLALSRPAVAEDVEDAVPIECGETIAGELTSADPDGFRDDSHHYDTYTFEGDADEFVTIDMIAAEPEEVDAIEEFEEIDEHEWIDELTEEDVVELLDEVEDEEDAVALLDEFIGEFGDPYLYLLGPDGAVLAEDDDSGFFLNSRIRQRIPETGEYTVVATSFGPETFFQYELSLECRQFAEVVGDGERIECGETVRGELTSEDAVGFRGPDHYHDAYVFEGEAGEHVTLAHSPVVFEDDPYLYLLGPDGAIVAEDDDSGTDLGSRLTAVLPQDGEYVVIATTFGPEDVFEYELSLECRSFQDVLGPQRTVRCGQTVAGELTSNDAVGFRGPDHYHDAYCFLGREGDTVRLSLSTVDGDTYLYLVDAAGQIVAEDDDGGNGLNSLIADQRLEGSGVYYVVATSFGSDAFFEYELSLECRS